MPKPRTAILLGSAALLAGSAVAWVVRERGSPAPCPYVQRASLDLPRPFLRRETLRDVLAPVPGERVLEVGPGTGHYTLPAAGWLAPGGRLDALDVQESMLDVVARRAEAAGIGNIVPALGDAQDQPYPDAIFDAAFLIATLGEIPDKDRALRELRRTLKPGGRLIVGEGHPDPHMVRSEDLLGRAEAAGLRYGTSRGGRIGYLARYERESDLG